MNKNLSHNVITKPLSSFDADALVRVVYVSMITMKGRLNPIIFEDLAKNAGRNNRENGITGVLTYGHGTFLQCIEGKKSEVAILLERIVTDNRHKNMKVLMCEPIESRYFNDWRMRMLFCERWLWSSSTRKQASQMLEFLPFRPYHWSVPKIDRFIDAIKSFEATVTGRSVGMMYNTLGQIVQRVAGPHQVFLLVQSVLGIMVIVSLFLIYSVF